MAETEGEGEEFANVEVMETDLVLVRRLEEELNRTRERLQRVIEEYDNSDQELKVANQELQSVNEELKSTTEELETSKEELQSMNEELITVNSDLLEKIDELHRINSDLSNLIASTDVGAIFLDTGLRVKRFTPSATDLFNLLEGDLGRPFAHVTHRIRHANLPALAKRVEELGTRIEETVQRDDERWYSLRMFPYRTVNGEREGVVITFVDINDLKRAESEERQRVQQQLLAQLGRRAMEEGNLDTLLFSTIQQVAVVLEMEMCKLLQIQPGGGPLLLRSGVGWQEGMVGVATVPSDATSQAGYTLRNAGPVVVRDFETETRFLRSPLLADHGVRSGISVTLFGPDGPYGVLSFHSRTPRTFATYDVDFVQSVANTLAAAIARQRAMDQLRASEATAQHYVEMIQASYDSIVVWSPAQGIEFWNQGAEKLYGYRSDEALGQATYELLATVHSQPLDEIMRSLKQQGEWEGELIHTTKAGQTVIVSTRHQLIQDQHGKALILEINRDITERKQSEADQQLVANVAEKIRLINDADALIQETVRLVSEHLQVGRCLLIEIDLEHDRGFIRGQYARGLPPVASEFQQSDYSPATRAELQAGHVLVNHDAKLDPRTAAQYDTVYAPADERAYVGVPLLHEGTWRGILSVTTATPRQWQPREVTLLESVGERLWFAVEKLRLNESLRAREAQLQLATTVARLGIAEVDYVTNSVQLDAESARLFGVADQALTLPRSALHAIVHPEDSTELWNRIHQSLDPKSSGELAMEHRVIWPDGQVRWLSVRERVFFSYPVDASPHPVYGLLVVIDITERKQAEETLRRQEAFVREIADNVPGLVGYMGADERYRFVNAAFESWFQKPRQRVLEDTALMLLGQDDYARLNGYRQRALAGEIMSFEEKLTYPDGITRQIWARYQPDFAADGSVLGFYLFVMDISEQKEAQEALRANEAQLSAILQNIPAAVYMLTPDHRYLYVNGYYEQDNQISNAEIRGLSIYDRYPQEIADALVANERQVLERKVPMAWEESAPRQDGIHYYATVKAPLLHPTGEPYAVLGVSLDITERKRAEQALRISAERLQLATQAGGVGIFDHDLIANRTEFSEIYAQITGFPMDGLLTREDWLSLVHPEDRSLVATIWDESRHTGNSYYYECRIVRPDGTLAWIEVNALLTRDEAGRSVRITGAVRDITERKQTALHQQFLLDLNSTLRTLTDPAAIQQTVVSRLGEYLGVSRCRFNTVDLAADRATLLASWGRSGLSPATDITPLSTYASPAYIASAQAGRTLVVDDANLDDRPELKPAHFRDRGFPATIRVPCLRNREWVATLHVLQDQPRHWRVDEVQLVESVVHHFWPLAEKARIEEALRESEARYRYLFETMDEGFCLVEMLFDEQGKPIDYRFLEANPAFEKFTGLHQAVGRTAREMVPDLEDYWWETYGQVAISGEPIRFEQGSEVMGRWFNVYAFRVGGEESRRVAILFSNITERKQSELSLARNNAILSGILESSSDAIFVRDLAGRYLLINSAGAEQVGMGKEAMIGKRYQELFPEDAASIERDDRPIFEHGLTFTTEQVSERNGELRYWNTLKMPLRTPDGQIIGLVSSARDMTERKQAEDELRRVYEVLSLAQRVSQSGVWDWDIAHNQTFWSPEYYNLYGLPAHVVPGPEAWIASIHPDDRARIQKRLHEVLQFEGSWHEEYRILHPERGERWLLGIGQVAYDESGKAIRFTGFNLDISERKAAEVVLARYQLLSEQARDIILFVRQDGRIVEANVAAVEAYGYDREMLLRMNISDLRHPATRMKIVEQIAQASQERQGHGVRFETVHLRQDGSSFPVEVSSVSTQVAGEQLLLSVIRDISERKVAEAALAASEAKFSTAFSFSPLMLTMTSLADGRLIEVNENFVRTTGYTRATSLGRTPDELGAWVNPEDRQRAIARLSVGETVQDVESLFRMKNGELRTFLLSATVVEINEQPCVLTAMTDITERKAAEAQLKRQAFLLENVGDAIFSTDMDFRILTWNRGAEEIYGRSAGEVIGQRARDLLRPDYKEGETTVDDAVKHILREGRWQGEVTHTHKDGNKLFISSTTTLLRDEEGNPTGIVAVNRDVTARRRAEERLRFMADASTLLASSLDYRVTLENVAHATVPVIADWCVIDLLAPDGNIVDAAVAHVDPEKVRWAKALRQRYPVDPVALAGAPNVIRTGKSEFYPDISDAMLAAVAKNEEELDLLRTVGYRSIMVVPLRSHDHILGAITFVISENERRFTESDLQMAEDLALRAAAAIENAQLYQAVQLSEAELRVSEERFRSAFEQAAVGMAHLNPEGSYLRVNDRLCEILGYSRQELLQMSYMDITHADDLVTDMTQAKRLLAGEIGHYGLEKRYIRQDGSAIWSNITVSAVRDDQNNVKYTIVVVEDISARKAAEDAVRRSEELARQRLVELEAIYNTAPIGLCVLDRDLRWQRINKHLAEINGYSVAEHLGRSVGELLPGVAPTIEPILHAILETGEPLPNVEIHGETPAQPGEKRIWLEHLFPLQDRDGIISGINVVAEEITERKRQERHQQFLSELGMQLRLLSDSDAILKHLVSRLGAYLQVAHCRVNEIDLANNQFIVQKNWTANGDSTYGVFPITELAPPQILRELQIGRTVVVDNTATDPRTASVLDNYRSEQTSALVGVPIFHEGQWWATLSVRERGERHWRPDEIALLETVSNQLRDLLEKVRAEEALVRLNATLELRVAERTAELERSNRELDQFAYIASHDLKAPLRAIENLANWISEDAEPLLPPASVEHLRKLRGRVDRMENLLEDLLVYSRANRVRGSISTVNLGAVVDDVVELLGPPDSFKVSRSAEMPTLTTYRAPLELVLRNLIGNAIKHHDRQDGEIHITVEEKDDCFEVTVRDDGPGIAPEFHERIFGMFQTLRPRDEVEASGIGLAVVKRTIESLGGKVWVESKLGGGSIFHFTWPKKIDGL
ncbi:MAG: PAS domain S-box protein [Caldilineaceae bacterium]